MDFAITWLYNIVNAGVDILLLVQTHVQGDLTKNEKSEARSSRCFWLISSWTVTRSINAAHRSERRLRSMTMRSASDLKGMEAGRDERKRDSGAGGMPVEDEVSEMEVKDSATEPLETNDKRRRMTFIRCVFESISA